MSSGYGAPGGGVSSGYGAPSGGGAPVYVYQQDGGGNGGGDGGLAGGLLAALLPLGALALLGGLGLFTFGAVFPTVSVVGRFVFIKSLENNIMEGFIEFIFP